MAHTFTAGKTYTCVSICDSDCIFEFKVIARTAKTVTIYDDMNGIRKRGISIDPFTKDETCFPYGHYSMCPILRA